MRIAQVQAALSTSLGTQNIASAETATPVGALLTFSSAITSGTAVRGSILGFGVYDGTNTRSGSAFSQDTSVTSSDTGGRASATTVLEIVLPTGTGVDAQAAPVGFIAGGIQINITNAPATALIVNATFFFADSASEGFFVTDLTPNASNGGTATSTGAPFAPNFAFAFTGLIGTTYNNARIQRGFACNNNGAIQQGSSAMVELDSTDPTACGQEVSAAYIQAVSGGARYAVTAFTPDGITIQTNGAGAQNIILALVKTTGRVWVGSPAVDNTSTGDKDITDPGFPAAVVGAIGTAITGNYDTEHQDTTAGHLSYGIGRTHTSLTQLLGDFQTTDNAAAPNQITRSVVEHDHLIRVIDDDGTDLWKAALVNSLSNGFRINVSAENLTTAAKVVFFCWSRPLVTSETVNIVEGSRLIHSALITSETVNVVEGSRIIHSAFLANETVNIGEGAVLVHSSLQQTEVGTIVEATVLVTDVGTEFTLATTEVVTVVEAATLVHSALINGETVEIYENTIFMGTGVGVTANETEHIMEGAVLVLGEVMTLSEIVDILDGFSFGDGLITIKRAGGRGQTVQGGALAAVTTQGGAERGQTQSG